VWWRRELKGEEKRRIPEQQIRNFMKLWKIY
jgi:hypothetical protein